MKNIFKVLIWIYNQIRSFIFPILLITIIGSVVSISSIGIALSSKRLVDSAVDGELNLAVNAAVLFGFLILFQLGLQAVDSIISTKVLEKLSNSLRKEMFSKLSRTIWYDFSKYHSDDILTRMTSDVGTVTNGIVNIIPGIISLVVRLIGAFIALLVFDPVLAVFAFALGPVSILFSRLFAKKLKEYHIKIQETEATYRGYIHESIQNIHILKSFCLEDHSLSKLDKLQNDHLFWVKNRSFLSAGTNTVLSLGYWVSYFLAFGWGAIRLSKPGSTFSFGTLTAFLQLVGQIQGPFIGLARSLPQIISTYASSERLIELENLNKEENSMKAPNWDRAGIRFENVDFSYEENKPILNNITTVINPGEIVAVIGTSGIGKTTVIRLLLSLIVPSKGSISFINSTGNEVIDASHKGLISYVPQGNSLYSGTIAENLCLGNTDASQNELEDAARAACALEFIQELPEGFNTKIGERGHGLSEGQAQRIAIARAFLHKTPILIFDEATSALDSETELQVLKSIQNKDKPRTCIIVTHRKAALEYCNRVWELKDGKLFTLK